jgi:nucleotide-binding universal stress UspA family protein
VPVIAVKKYKPVSSIKNLVFPNTLGIDQEDLTMRVKSLQEFFKAKLHIVYINTPANFRQDAGTKQELNAFAKRFMLKNVTLNVFNDLDQDSGVINFAHDIGADMIVMATHGRRGLSHLLNGSIAEDVVNHVDCPIWTCVEK